MMENNVYVRSKTSIKSISLSRIIFLLPLIIYGIYKNGIYLYMNHFVNLFGLFKPLIFIIIGGLMGLLVNIIYEKILKRRKENLLDIIFSSFHIEYGIILGSLMSINTNIFIFTIVTFFIFLISKFLNNRINSISLVFIFVYSISIITGKFFYENPYELSKTFSLNVFDYLIGRGVGGIGTTHILLLMVSLVFLTILNNNKTEITLYSVLSYIIPITLYGIIAKLDVLTLIFNNSYLFIFTFVATDMVTSSYTSKGKVLFGILIGLTSFGFYFLNPILAPFISVAIISLLNNLIDRLANNLKLN